MTLLTTEIHRTAAGDVIVFAADRRITRRGVPAGDRKKIFKIPACQTGIGYFGLAEVCPTSTPYPISEWIQDLLYHVPHTSSPAEIANLLCAKLNSAVPAAWRDSEPSGFHVAGLRATGLAEFWYVRNIDDDGRVKQGGYEAREDFFARDAPSLPTNGVQIYRNGDIRAQVACWEQIDRSLGALLGRESFRALSTPKDYTEWVKYKMELVVNFYERFATESIIGGPVDAFVISADS